MNIKSDFFFAFLKRIILLEIEILMTEIDRDVAIDENISPTFLLVKNFDKRLYYP